MSDVASLLWVQLWQVTVVAAVVIFCVRVFAKDRPHLAHALWVLVLLKCITPPVFSSQLSPFSWVTAPASVQSTNGEEASPEEIALLANADPQTSTQVTQTSSFGIFGSKKGQKSSDARVTTGTTATSTSHSVQWTKVFWGTWLFGAAVCLILQMFRLIRFIRKIHRTRAPRCCETEFLVNDLASQLGLRQKVRTLITHAQINPAVIGLFRPTVLLPTLITEQPSPNLRPLIAHELIHIRRGDLWWALLQTLSGSLFWFHPLVRLAVNSITRESERSCDEETIASLNITPANYARSLLDVLEKKQLQTVPALPGVKPVEITSNRLERVMKLGHGSHKRTPWWTWIVLFACCAIILPGASLVNGQAAEESPKEVLPKADQTLPLIEKSNEADPSDNSTCVYDVKDIIKTLQQGSPTEDVQEIELKLLNHLRAFPIADPMAKQNPKSGTVLQDGKIITTRSKKGHLRLHRQLERISKNGFRQIVLETRIVAIPKNRADKFAWKESQTSNLLAKNGEVRREQVSKPEDVKASRAGENVSKGALIDKYPVKVASLLEEDSDDNVHRLCKADVHTWPVFETSLDKGQLSLFLQKHSEKVTRTPTVTLLEGAGGVIRDTKLRPFVTQVLPIKSGQEDGLVAHQPVISLLPDGTSMTISGNLTDNNEFRIFGDLTFSQIDHVSTFTFHLDGTAAKEGEELKQGLTIQLPVISASKLDFDGTVKPDQTMALRFTNPMEDDIDLVFLITPTLIKESELNEELSNPNNEVNEPRYRMIDIEPKSTAPYQERTLPQSIHFRFSQELSALIEKHNVSTTASEIEVETQKISARSGMTSRKWKEVVCASHSIDESELENMIESELCFRKLSVDIQNEFVKEIPTQETIIIRHEDPKKNVSRKEARMFVNNGYVIYVHTDVAVDENKNRLMIDGKNLEIGFSSDDFQVEPMSSADHIQLTLDGKDISMVLSNGTLMIGAAISADKVQYHHSADFNKLEFTGNVRFESEKATFHSDFMKLGDNGTVFRGNVKVQFKGLNITAEEMHLGDDGSVTVDGIEQGLKIEF